MLLIVSVHPLIYIFLHLKDHINLNLASLKTITQPFKIKQECKRCRTYIECILQNANQLEGLLQIIQLHSKTSPKYVLPPGCYFKM